MKILIFIAFATFCAVTNGVFVPPRPGHQKQHLLGAKECTWGPSYWCQNLTSAAGCNAVKHCIQTVWIQKQLPPDTSSVCQTCLDMVKQARDQLESNETQELIKEVFEGSCALLHVKPVVKECDKICDQYIPELIDTLASEMNPQVVCSVAGLCNNEKVHRLLAEAGETITVPETVDTCKGCHTVLDILEDKFNKMSRDDVLGAFLGLCGRTGSLSDGCSNIVITYFTEIYKHLQDNFNANDVCLLSGECHAMFHTHANVEITPISHIGYVQVDDQKEDLPCELCEQLVSHLRDLLVANTTEDEFKKVLEGLCKQTKSFSAQCLSLVDEYYAVAYDFLTNELDPSTLCKLATICPNNDTLTNINGAPIVPLLPVENVPKTLEITPAPVIRINMAKDGSSVKILQTPEQAQLPIDLLMPPHTQVLYNKEACVFCEYFLHYVQEAITDPKTEDKIKAVIDEACDKLPSSVNETCREFVNMYEPALMAILAQEIDPSQVCPLIKVCPSSEVKDVDIFMHQGSDGSKCPLCLFAVSHLEEMVKDKKTESNIRDCLARLCSKLPSNLVEECVDFVNTYTDELVQMMMADLNPQEVCVYLKLCSANDSRIEVPDIPFDTNTNIIVDYTVNGKPTDSVQDKPQCVICEFVMQQLQDELKDKKTEDEIINAVKGVCKILPKSVRKQCDDFVNEYGDMVIQLLIEATEPSDICRMINLCANQMKNVQAEIFDCAVCESIVYAMEKILTNPKVDHTINHVLEKACRALPKRERNECVEIIDKYGKTIYDLIIHQTSKHLICKEIGLCKSEVSRPNRLVGESKCSWGPGYWCASEQNAADCGEGARKHCQEKVWPTKTKRAVESVGSSKCTWGPGYWCASQQNAADCGQGAIKHCQEKVWSTKTKRAVESVGSSKCTWGPGYWCASQQNAVDCGQGAINHCRDKVWVKGVAPKS